MVIVKSLEILYICNYIFIKNLIFYGYCSYFKLFSAFMPCVFTFVSVLSLSFLILDFLFYFLYVFTLLSFNYYVDIYSKFVVDGCSKSFFYLHVFFCLQICFAILFLIYSFGY